MGWLQTPPRVRTGGPPADPGRPPGPIVLLANVPFRTVWQRCHQLAIGLAGFTDVVYVDPNHSFLQPVRRRAVVPPGERLPDRLHLFTPPPGLPAARDIGACNRLNYRRAGRALARFLRARGLAAPAAVVLTFPDQIDALPHVPAAPTVYDLMDEPELFLKPGQWRRRYARLHADLVRRADVLVVSARVLLDRYRPAAPRAVWISNGVRDELLSGVTAAEPDPALAALPGPRFGYVGMISHWFDFDAVRAVAEAHPNGSVVLVGPTDVRPPNLPRNVVFTGPVPHARLGSVLAAFDVGLIPFVPSPAIDAVNPVKVYEYWAAGLPVLASDFREIGQYRPLVHTYRTPGEAAATAGKLAADPDAGATRAERRAFAAGHRWGAKAAQFAAAVRDAAGLARSAA